jgi:hypothetical protein
MNGSQNNTSYVLATTMSASKKQLEENQKSKSWSLKKKLENLATVSEEGDKDIGSKSRSSNPIKSRSSSH